MKGMRTKPFSLTWEDTYDDQMRRAYSDEQSVTERAAVAVSIILALHTTAYNVSVIEFSTPKAKFDIKQ